MGVQDDVEPILGKIRAQAEKRYEIFISDVPDKDRHPEIWIKDRRDFMGTVDDLLTRFREFYVLDQHDFTPNVQQLATPAQEKPKLGQSVPLVNYPYSNTAFGNVFSADVNFTRPVVEMIHTEQWNGDAATAFRDEFLAPFTRAADWQGAYIKELAVAAEIYRATTEVTKKGVTFVAEGCLGALSYHPIYEPSDGDRDLRSSLGAASLILAAIALFLPASTAALVVGGASLASGIASVPPPENKPYLHIEHNDFPQSIIRFTEYALKDLRDMVFDVDDTLAAGLDKDLASSDRFGSPYLRLGAAPIGPEAYSDLDIKDGDGKPPNQVVVSIVQLARAGYYNLPGAAYEYDQALSRIDACQIPGSMATFFPRSIGKFNSATGDLAQILRQTRDRLNNAGDAMLTAARNYRGTDEENAEIIKGINELTPHHSRAPFH